MPQKLRSKIVLESHGLGFDVAEASQEGTVPTMVEQLEKILTSPLPVQDEDVSDNPTGQGGVGGTSNVDVPIHLANTTDDF